MTARLAVVTVTWSSSDTIGPFLSSLHLALDRAGSPDAEVLVVDNASPEARETAPLVEAAGARFVELPENRGYGAGVTAGVALLQRPTELLVVCNPDVVVAPDALVELLGRADVDPTAGAWGPRILDAEGGTYPSARSLPSLRTGVGHAVLGRVWPGNPWSRSYKADRDLDRVRDAGWLSGAFLLLRRTAFDEVGGFDDSYFMYFEDVDLGARLGRAGWRNVYVPSAVVVHAGARSTSREPSRMERVHHESAYRYLSRRYRGPFLAPVRLALRVGLAARARWVTRGAHRG